MRVLTADAANAGDSIADVLASWAPAVAALTSISPTDACTVATKLGLRYSVQCWDAPQAGKAVFWKPSLPLQGLYRIEFMPREGGAIVSPTGMLRVTLIWDGNPLHVLCAQLAAAPPDANWQLVQVARELDDAKGAAILAIDAAGAALPAWPAFADVWYTARWRSICYPDEFDASVAAREAFGITSGGTQSALSSGAWLGGGRVRLFSSDYFSVVHARHVPPTDEAGDNGALIADFISRSNGPDNPLNNGVADGLRRQSASPTA